MIKFAVKFVPVGTGQMVYDHPNVGQIVKRFMPKDRQHPPMVGIIHFGAVRPTPNVLQDIVVEIGEDTRAGRYGNFTFVVSSEDDATRNIITNIASAQDLPIFVSSSPVRLENAEPAGGLTTKDRETLSLVLEVGGTVTAGELAQHLGTEATTIGNRLNALHKKGYLQRLERPHPLGDQFIDARSIQFNRTTG